MPRTDLLALTHDDLAALSNRGTVKRAERELESGAPACQIDETPAGDLVFTWSDGVVCQFPAGESVHNAICSSGTPGISRHVIRSVLAYRRHCEQQKPAPTAVAPAEIAAAGAAAAAAAAVAAGAWDPGAFTDDELVARFRQTAIVKARKQFEQGLLVELTRGAKPLARFLDTPCTLRFLVAGDLRYVTADCAEALLPLYVPLAIWAFRMLPAERTAGLIAAQQAELPVPALLLDELETLLIELASGGVAGCGASWPQRLTRLEAGLRSVGLVWPAEIVVDLLQQQEMYSGHDARFD